MTSIDLCVRTLALCTKVAYSIDRQAVGRARCTKHITIFIVSIQQSACVSAPSKRTVSAAGTAHNHLIHVAPPVDSLESDDLPAVSSYDFQAF